MNAPPSSVAEEKSSQTTNCYHCGDDVAGAKITQDEKSFCCEGCRTAYRIIAAGGLDGYYRHRQEFGSRPAEAEPGADDLYDLYEADLKPDPNGNFQVVLRVSGIHCASCVWLNEKILGSLEGVVAVEVRLATRRAHITYDPARVHLRELAAGAAGVGYRLLPMDGAEESRDEESRDLLTRLGVAGFFAGNMMLVSVALYAGYFDSMERLTRNTLHLVSFLFALPVVLYSARPFFRGAYHAVRYRVPSMDILLSIGVSLAFSYSLYSALNEAGEVYFDSITFVVFAVLTGRFLESRLRMRGRQQIENLRSGGEQPVYLLAKTDSKTEAEVGSETDGEESERPLRARDVRADQLIRVPAGQALPADGILIGQRAELDESLLTGEYRPVPRNPGDALLAGARPVGGSLTMRATRDHGASTLARLHDLVENSMSEEVPASQLTARVARWFVLFVLAAAGATFAFWFWRGDVARGVHATIALLIVACPCALSLAIPMARVVALGMARRAGCLFKNGVALETLARVDVMLLDKTGTLTRGQPRVERIELGPAAPVARDSATPAYEPDELILLARDLQTAARTRHPVAEAFRLAGRDVDRRSENAGSSSSHGAANDADPIEAGYVPGRGVSGSRSGTDYLLGSRSFLREAGVELSMEIANESLTEFEDESGDEGERSAVPGELSVYLASRDESADRYELLAVFYLSDELRPEAAGVIPHLARGRDVALVSGDLKENARHVADQLGIASVRAEQSPAQKEAYVQERSRTGTVCMVGDGINDAAALASADCGVSFASAAEISLVSADVLLLGDDLEQLRFVFDLARATRRKIMQNLALSFAYNLTLIPLAFAGWIVPVAGAIFMALSSLTVVANSLLLGRALPAATGDPDALP